MWFKKNVCRRIRYTESQELDSDFHKHLVQTTMYTDVMFTQKVLFQRVARPESADHLPGYFIFRFRSLGDVLELVCIVRSSIRNYFFR